MPNKPEIPQTEPNPTEIVQNARHTTLVNADIVSQNASIGTESPDKKNTPETAQLKRLQRLVRRKKDNPFKHLQTTNKRAYCTALMITGMHGKACALAGIEKTTPFKDGWKEDAELQEAVRIAKEASMDHIEDAMYQRAVYGTLEPTGFYKGEVGEYVRRYDTTAGIFLLKGGRPEKYAERSEVRNTTIFAGINLNLLPDSAIHRIGKGGESLDVVVTEWLAELRSQGQDPPAGLLPGPG